TPVQPGQARQQGSTLTAGDGVIRQPKADGIRAIETGAGQTEPERESPRHPARKPAGPHIRIEAERHLRHGEQALPGHQPNVAAAEQAYAPPHADAIRHTDEGLAVAVDMVVEPILLLKEIPRIAKQRLLALLLSAVIEGADVTTGAKCL